MKEDIKKTQEKLKLSLKNIDKVIKTLTQTSIDNVDELYIQNIVYLLSKEKEEIKIQLDKVDIYLEFYDSVVETLKGGKNGK